MNALYRLLLRLRVLLVFLILEAGAFWLFTHNSYYQHSKIVGSIRLAKGMADEKLDAWQFYFSLRETNEQLAHENNLLRNRLEEYQRQASPPQAIVMDTLQRPVYSYISATVVNNSVHKMHNYLMLHAGSDDGVQPDMGVIVHNGVVGTVISVSAHYSLVQSLLNIDGGANARLTRSGEFGPLFWNGANYREVILTDIQQHKSVAIGDTVVSSGNSDFFPPGIPIGTVKDISSRRGNYHEIAVTLFADFKQLRHVQVVQHLYRREIESLAPPRP